jgi:CDP-glucose 4,6-dehydratase
LVTGATGFLGGWLLPRLLSAGNEVVCCLNPNSNSSHRADSLYRLEHLSERCTELRVNLGDFAAVAALIGTVKPDAIIHMAAVGDVTVSLKNPLETFNASATSAANIFEAVRRSGRPIPVISHTTDKVYGANQVPFSEDMPLKPFHVYEIAKASQDILGQFYGKTYGLPIATVRCANYFGGYDFNFNRIVPYAIRQCLRDEDIVLRSHGNFTRDFLYVEDAVDVNLLLLDRLLAGDTSLHGEVFNFSLEVQLTVREVVATICRLMDREARVRVEATAMHEIPDMRLDCTKARRLLGWAPAHSLQSGLRQAILHYRRYFDRSRVMASGMRASA